MTKLVDTKLLCDCGMPLITAVDQDRGVCDRCNHGCAGEALNLAVRETLCAIDSALVLQNHCRLCDARWSTEVALDKATEKPKLCPHCNNGASQTKWEAKNGQ